MINKPNCPKDTYTGKSVRAEVALVCGDVDPRTLTNWLPIGGIKTKSLDMSQDTTDATNDSTIGDFREMVGTYKNFSFSADGVCKANDSAQSNLVMLNKMYAAPGELSCWLRLTYPDLTYYAFIIISNLSREAPSDDVATFSLEAVATANPFGVIVEDTPSAADAKPTAITVIDNDVTVIVGADFAIDASVTPTTASTKLRYVSDKPEVAMVDTLGNVKAVAVGEAIITVVSLVAPSVKTTVTVTVE